MRDAEAVNYLAAHFHKSAAEPYGKKDACQVTLSHFQSECQDSLG